jgi:tetratricopeptide (TPR) repeat protein
MPYRGRAHELEEMSRRAFASSLPGRMVFEDRRSDYGIDGHVEIFREEQTTGLFFDVQLKGTDKDLSIALKVLIPHAHEQYYRSLDRPLLMVRFHAPSNAVYVRWFHAFDPHYGGVNKKTITFRWSKEDLWDQSTAARLEAEAEAFRRFRSAALSLPITFTLSSDHERLYGMESRQLMEEIKETLNSAIGDVMRITLENDALLPSIELSPSALRVDLLSVATATIHSEGETTEHGPTASFHYDVGLAVALLLDQIGHSDAAARISVAIAADSSLIHDPDILVWIAGTLARTRRIHESLDLAERLRVRGDLEAQTGAELVRVLPMLFLAGSPTEGERAAQITSLQNEVATAERENDWRRARAAHYNLARTHRSFNQELSFHHFCQAAAWDPGYLNRDYLCKELGGLFFDTGFYEFSAQAYSRAIDLGMEGITPLLLADALMLAGRYQEAKLAFSNAVEQVDRIPAELFLKTISCGWIHGITGIDNQDRQLQEALDVVQEATTDLDVDQRIGLCTAALEKDALCGLAWYTIGTVLHDVGERLAAFRAFLIVATIQPENIDAWVNVLATVPEGDTEPEQEAANLVGAVVAAAHRRHGDRLEGAFRASLVGSNEDAKDELIRRFRDLIDSVVEEEEEELELRLLAEEGDDYDVLRLPRPNQ